jgi:hypothetical protein
METLPGKYAEIAMKQHSGEWMEMGTESFDTEVRNIIREELQKLPGDQRRGFTTADPANLEFAAVFIAANTKIENLTRVFANDKFGPVL